MTKSQRSAVRWLAIMIVLNYITLIAIFGWAIQRTRISAVDRQNLQIFVEQQMINHRCEAAESHGSRIPDVCFNRAD